MYTSEEARSRVDRTNPKSPLFKIVGNKEALDVLSWILYDALLTPNHVCTQNLAFVGPASTGKTMISRIFAEVLEIPHIEISPKSVDDVIDVVNEIHYALQVKKNIYTIREDGVIVFPPIVILLDEAHAFKDNVIQALLKATERSDGLLYADDEVFNCCNVCWHFATTDLGKIFDAFITRFEKISLRLYTKDEIAEIISKNNIDWDKSICGMIANYCNRIPREALAFASLVRKAQKFFGNSWENAAAEVAEKKGIDKYGMTTQRLNILRALGQRPMSLNQLCTTAGCKEEELRLLVMPWLLEWTPDQEPFIATSNRHYITKEGLAELDKRGILHKEGSEIN